MSGRFQDSVELEIDASPQLCFDAMADFASYPKWQTAVKEARVIDRRPEGPVVEYTVDLLVRKIRYVLAYRTDPEKFRISWDYVEGDAADVAGEFIVEPLVGGRRSRATYRLEIDPGFYVPGLLISKIKNVVMKGVLKDLRRRVES